MSPWLPVALAGGAVLSGAAAALPRRLRRLAPLALLLGGAGIALALIASLGAAQPAASLAEAGLGRLVPSRLPLGLIVGAFGALLLEVAMFHRRAPSGATVGISLLVGVAGCLALLVTGFVPLALLLTFMCAAIWVRWQRLGGPNLGARSLARQTALVLALLLAAAAVLPSERIGAAPAALAAILVVGGLGGVAGLLPISSWVGVASRVTPAEAAAWRIWLAPVAVVVLARLLVASPPGMARDVQLLLVGLGLVTAIFWASAGLLARPEGRYWRLFQADVGVMCVAVGSGDRAGMAAALLLVLVHWLAGSVLGEADSSRSQLLAWVGISGVPPFGGFAGRLLALVAVTFMGPVVVALLLVAYGLQLAACGAGLRDAVRATTPRGPAPREVAALAAAIGVLAVGLAGGPLLQWIFGVSP